MSYHKRKLVRQSIVWAIRMRLLNILTTKKAIDHVLYVWSL